MSIEWQMHGCVWNFLYPAVHLPANRLSEKLGSVQSVSLVASNAMKTACTHCEIFSSGSRELYHDKHLSYKYLRYCSTVWNP